MLQKNVFPKDLTGSQEERISSSFNVNYVVYKRIVDVSFVSLIPRPINKHQNSEVCAWNMFLLEVLPFKCEPLYTNIQNFPLAFINKLLKGKSNTFRVFLCVMLFHQYKKRFNSMVVFFLFSFRRKRFWSWFAWS